MITKRKKRLATPLSPASGKRVIVGFPAALYEKTEQAVREVPTTRSMLIRSAVEHYLRDLDRQRLESELAAGYAANAALDRRICADFTYSDSENL